MIAFKYGNVVLCVLIVTMAIPPSESFSADPALNSLAYRMSKAALDYFTRCVASELAGKGVRVNSVNPGLIVTDFQIRADRFNATEYRAFLEEKGKQCPVGRAGETCEVVAAIAFLDQDSASFITGVRLPVDGGACLKST